MKRTFFNSKGKDKQYIVIGCGRFGSSVAKKMCQLGNEVMVIDKDEDSIENIAEQYGIYLGQLHLEKSLDAHDYAVTDYATFVPYIYGRLMLGDKKRTKKEIEILNDLYSLAIRDLPQYDHIFFVPREFGYKKDGVRWQDEEVAQMVDKAILGFLDAENVKYSVIKGSTKERSEQIMKIVGINKEIVQPVKVKEVVEK